MRALRLIIPTNSERWATIRFIHESALPEQSHSRMNPLPQQVARTHGGKSLREFSTLRTVLRGSGFIREYLAATQRNIHG
jgi:hypothetical protein